MSSGSVEAQTVGYVIAYKHRVAGENKTSYAGEYNGHADFLALEVRVYPTINAAIDSLERRAVKYSGGYCGDVTLERVVERTVTSTERSYEAL